MVASHHTSAMDRKPWRPTLRWELNWRLAALKSGFSDAMAYRLEFFLEILGYAAVPAAVQMVLWYAMFTSGGQATVAGHTAEMMTYTLTTVIFSQVRGGNHDFELAEMIGQALCRNISCARGSRAVRLHQGVAGKLLVALICLMAGLVASPGSAPTAASSPPWAWRFWATPFIIRWERPSPPPPCVGRSHSCSW